MRRRHSLIVLTVLIGLPFVVILQGCSFDLPKFWGTELVDHPPKGMPDPRGEPPYTAAIFCNIESDRRCSTPTERLVGVDVADQYAKGFWIGKSSPFGLDYSLQALSECGGQPQTVQFRGPFPDGSAVGVNPETFLNGTFTSVKAACEAWCDGHAWIDNSGTPYRCDHIAWPATGVTSPILNAFTPTGILRVVFRDLRKIRPKPVVWTDRINVAVSQDNTLRKTSPGLSFNSGATSIALLMNGDGFVEFTATETSLGRVCGLAKGGHPDFSTGPADIDFGMYLRADGLLVVYESGVEMSAPIPYAPLDRIRVAVVGGVVHYFKNDVLLQTASAQVTYPMRVDASLLNANATIANAQTTF